jgi:hypothetical protein
MNQIAEQNKELGKLSKQLDCLKVSKTTNMKPKTDSKKKSVKVSRTTNMKPKTDSKKSVTNTEYEGLERMYEEMLKNVKSPKKPRKAVLRPLRSTENKRKLRAKSLADLMGKL